MVDALTAARSALPTSFAPTITDSGKLFVTGYSQGGHVAMATHKLLQETGATITASAPMSGPYAVAAFSDAVFFGQVTRTTPLFLAFTATGYQKAYGDVYASPTDIFEARYATGIESLLPSCSAAHAAVRGGQAAARSIVQQHAARSELRAVHAGNDARRTSRPSSRRASVRSTW